MATFYIEYSSFILYYKDVFCTAQQSASGLIILLRNVPSSPHPYHPPLPGLSLIQMKCSANGVPRCRLYRLPY